MKYGCLYSCLFLLSPLVYALEPTNAGAIRFEGLVTDPSCQITPAALQADGRKPYIAVQLLECRTSVQASLGTSVNATGYLKNHVLRADRLTNLPHPQVAGESMMLTLDYF